MNVRTRLALAASVATVAASAAFFAPATYAHPGHPGQATDNPVVLFLEDFEDDLDDGEVGQLDDYKSGDYTADAAWLAETAGNGILVDGNATNADLQDPAKGNFTSGDATADQDLRDLANKVGDLNGTSDNHLVSAYTNQNPGANLIEFALKDPLTLSSKGRFLTISANIGAINCYAAHPKINFFLVDDGGAEQPVNDSALDGCGSSNAAAATATHLAGGRAVLFESTSVGVVMRNAEGSGGGNDHSFDDITVLDATPQLDKVFEDDGPLKPGETTNLILTVTNTSELAAKPGWSFTDHLPSGLTVAGAANSTCDAEVTAASGAKEIEVDNGNLAQSEVSCSVTVPVKATKGGTFRNDASNIESVGLNDPGATRVVYVAPAKDKKKDKDDNDDNDDSDDNDDNDDKELPSTGAPWYVNPWTGVVGVLLAVGGTVAFARIRRTLTEGEL